MAIPRPTPAFPLFACALLALASMGITVPATAQEAARPAAPAGKANPKVAVAPPLHRPEGRIDPDVAFRHLRSGTVRWRAARTAGTDPTGPDAPPLLPRPGGAGRYLAAVFASSELPFPAHELLGVPATDLYLMSSPGPLVRTPEVALTEVLSHSAEVSLAVILVHERCVALNPPGPDRLRTKAGSKLEGMAARARARGTAQNVPLALAHGLEQSDALWNGSELLRESRRRHRFGIAIGVVDDVTGNITWHAPELGGWPRALAPIYSGRR